MPRLLVLLSLLSITPGCILPPPTNKPSVPLTEKMGDRLTTVKLQSLLMDYADRYASLVSSTADEIRFKEGTPEARKSANLLKLVNCTAVFSIAASPNPEVGLLDMVVHVSLVRGRFKDGTAQQIFKDSAPLVLSTYDSLYEDIWELATQALSDEQLDELGGLITQWRKKNPQYKYLSNIRFSDFADARYLSTLVNTESGFISLGRLVPIGSIDDATREIREARMLGERASWLTMRMPTLMRWQIEVLADQLLATAEVKQTQSDFTNLSKATTRMSATVEDLPKLMETRSKELRELLAEFQKTFDAGHKLVESITKSAAEIQKTTRDSRETALAINTAIRSSDEILDRFSSTTKPTRFAIEKFTESFEKARAASEELNKLAANIQKLTEKSDVTGAPDAGLAKTRQLVDHFAWRMFQLAGGVCVLVLLTRLIGCRRRRHGAR